MKTRLKPRNGPTRSVSETLSFSFDPEGWATFTLCEETGELSVRSDWGDGSYHWPRANRAGRSLKDFLAERSHVDYLVDKLCRGRDFESVIDGRATARALRAQIKEHLLLESKVRSPESERGYKAVLRDVIEKFTQTLDGRSDSTNGGGLNFPTEIYDLCDGEPWYFIKTRESYWKDIWRKILLPTFVRYLQKEGYGKPRVAVDSIPTG